MIDSLREFENRHGWIVRYLVILMFAGAIFFADSRYPTREEIGRKEANLHKMREEDLRELHRRIQYATDNNADNLNRISESNSRLARIEAQMEIIIRTLEKISDGQ